MDSEKKELFLTLNDIDSLSTTLFICARCQNWLIGESTKDASNGNNFCQLCSSLKNKQMDDLTKTLLKNMKYPCLHKGCDYIGKNQRILMHTTHCEHAPNDCDLCAKSKMDYDTYKDHVMTEHTEAILEIDTPQLTLSIQQLQKNDKYIVTFKNHIFLLFIILKDNMVTMNMAKLFQNRNEEFSKTFTVTLKSEGINQELTKNMVPRAAIKYFSSTETIKFANPKEIQIYFCKFNKTIQLGECPICDRYMDVRMYQCANGHNVCIDCGTKITVCAICRDDSLNQVNCQFLFPNAFKSCENAEHGCLFVGEKGEHATHSNRCLYKTRQCPVCNETCGGRTLHTHMAQKHKTCFFNNGTSLNAFVSNEKKFQALYYCVYNDVLFKIRGATLKTTAGQEYRSGFSVKTAHGKELSEAEKYGFEIQIRNKKHKKTVHRLRGVCQAADEEDSFVFINFETWKKHIADVNDGRRVYFKCIITRTDYC